MDGFSFNPVVWVVLHSMRIMILVHMVGRELTRIPICIVQTVMASFLRAHIVVLAMLFSAEVTVISNRRGMGHMSPVVLVHVGCSVPVISNIRVVLTIV